MCARVQFRTISTFTFAAVADHSAERRKTQRRRQIKLKKQCKLRNNANKPPILISALQAILRSGPRPIIATEPRPLYRFHSQRFFFRNAPKRRANIDPLAAIVRLRSLARCQQTDGPEVTTRTQLGHTYSFARLQLSRLIEYRARDSLAARRLSATTKNAPK